MLHNFALHLDIPHYPSGLQVLVQYNALKAHFVLVLCVALPFGVITALITPDQVEKYHTEIVSDVFMLLVPHDLIERGELYLLLLDQLSEVSK